MKTNKNQQNILKILEGKYRIFRDDAAVTLYGKGDVGYVATIYSRKDGFDFKERYYADGGLLVTAIESYVASLPFPPSYYNPMNREHVFIEKVSHDYLRKLDFEYVSYGVDDFSWYKFKNYCQLGISCTEDTQDGIIRVHVDRNRWVDQPFSGLDECLGAINEMMLLFLLPDAICILGAMDRMNSAAPLFSGTIRKVDMSRFKISDSSLRDFAAEKLESALKQLKED